jgi:DNA-binding NtrC family response regulator
VAFRILVAEDEDITRKHIVNTLSDEGYDIEATDDGLKALKIARSGNFDVLITDIKMPGMDGMQLLSNVKETSPDTEVIVITGYGSINSAVSAMKIGAHDYVTKPFELEELSLKVAKIIRHKTLTKENLALRTSLNVQADITIIAESRGMKKVLDTVANIQGSDCSVLLTGESGVGKNLLAKVIHYSSSRKEGPFLSVNCSTFTEDLLASELFGFEKGAFTGASSQKKGLVEIADNGTLYLDEIAEMSPNLQAKLLKVIEEKEFYRVGGTRPMKIDVRFIAATNQNINQSIEQGTFRRDLYYRLNVMEILIPPLRERRDDIEPLSRYFFSKHLPKYRKNLKGFTKEAMRILKNYSFPGNVRELENMIERAIILETSNNITPDSLPQTISMFKIETLTPDSIKSLEHFNKDYVRSVVEMLGGNKAEAARHLGISRTSLWRMLKDE